MPTDHNLLFGVLALQADLLTTAQFVEACSAWAVRKAVPLADLLVERGWLTADEVRLVEMLASKKLARHGGDPQATLAAVLPDEVRQTLAGVADEDVRATLAFAGGPRSVLLSGPSSPTGSRDRYTTTRLHATGGLGRVWLAHDAGMDRDVAMKELLPERTALPEAAARFLREARITGQLEHPGIVPVYELVHEPGAASPFYTMRFIRGRTFGEAIAAYHARRGAGTAEAMELRDLLTAFAMLCQAVAYAHSRRVVHRDLKPANVVLGDFGEVILLDWGIAKVLGEAERADADLTVTADRAPAVPADGALDATRQGQVLGTPSYMAPEQAGGDVDAIDERTDVYGLGAILFEILTGTVPFRGRTASDVLAQVRDADPPRPTALVRDAPRPLEAVALKCLSKAPGDRYASAKAVASEVAHFLADEPVAAYRDPLRVRVGRWSRRHRTLASGLAAALLVALPVLLVSLLLVSDSARREKDARVAADASRDDAEANFQKAVRAADLVSGELARGVKPIAGTQSKTVLEILARAEAVYDDLLAGPNPPARARLNKAKLLVLVSEVYRGMNLLAPARDRAAQAVGICAALSEADPGVREYRTTLAAAHHRRGWAAWDIGKGTEALGDFAAGIRLLDAADAADAADPEETFALASCLTLSGNIRLDFGDPAAAKPLYERGLVLREALHARNPGDPANTTQLATSCERFGLYHRKHGDAAAGLVFLRRAVGLNATAFAADRNNQEIAVNYVRTLNTLAGAELGEEREAAVGRMGIARDLAETFARRDPDNNLWEREAIRSRWSFRELEQRDWGKMTPEQRIASRRALVAAIQDIIRISDRRIALSPENVVWLSDRGNVRARLAVALLGLADAGAEPEKNRRLALEQGQLSVADYDRVVSADPNTYEQKLGWVYAMSAVRDAMIAVKPDAAALAYHWKYSAVEIRAHLENQRAHPENFVSRGYCGRSFFNAGLLHRELSDDWLALSADAAVLDAMLDLAAALPDPATVTDPVLSKQLASARVRMAGRLRKLDGAIPLPARGKKLLESLAESK